MPIRPIASPAPVAPAVATPRIRVRGSVAQKRPVVKDNMLREYEPNRLASLSVTYPPRYVPEGAQVQIGVTRAPLAPTIRYEAVRISDGVVIASNTTHDGLERDLINLQRVATDKPC